MIRIPTILAALPLFAALAPAQHTILLAPGPSDERTLGLDAPETDLMRTDEIYEVFPTPGGGYTARPFLPISTQWHYAGDTDSNGQYVQDSVDGPGGTLDAVFLKAGTTGPVTTRDVYWSIASTSGINIPGLLVSDVVRYSGQGVVEKFLTQAQLNVACGIVSTSTTMNLDALAQSAAGDLFFSVSLTTTINGTSMDDGDMLYIPAGAITYDGSGNVSTIAAGTAVRIATQADLIAFAMASGYKTSVGGDVTTSFELSGLEMDPNGGTWTTPEGALVLPNVLYVWSDFSNDGAVISTAAGGSIAVINGVPLGSTVATLGDQLGYLPDSTGINGPNGLALAPAQAPAYALLNYPRNLHTSGNGQTFLNFEVSGGTPGGISVFVWSVESMAPGGAFPAVPAIPPFSGEFGISAPIIIGFQVNDALGNSSTPMMVLSTAAMSGANLACQALDFTTFRLSTPTGLSFL